MSLPGLKGAVGVAFTDEGGDREWFKAGVMAQLPDAPLVELDPTGLGVEYWGSHGHLEVVLHPLDLATTAQRAQASLKRTRCRWCRSEIAASPCAFCGMAAREMGEAA